MAVHPDELVKLCPTLWHVAPAGAWDRIKEHGLRTAEQLILAADLDDEARTELLERPRQKAVQINVGGDMVTLRDQAALFGRKDQSSQMGEGVTVEDWVRRLNRRVFLFATRARLETMLKKYVELDGAQDVIVLSPRALLEMPPGRIELASQNSGSVARQADAQKHADAFLSIARFPSKRPTEVTVVDGLDDHSAIIRAERHHADRPVEPLS